ncbi:hypothetical protein GSI_09294 [Ganoderma sinense ZZ0214-1]|uniref:Peptide hydrolase n=1 Tax=Ganoderma sinense ZZ0214-1 TaxID=1077348 RepID=A0A2G8S670_9APHY|nr:hypothetical protein GSI_09294 [Ganoderma sinense ZZ0214-1]
MLRAFARLYLVLVQLAVVLPATTWASPISTQQVQGVAAKGYRLLDLQPGVEPVWKTEEDKLELLRQGVHFFDVTEVYDPEEAALSVNIEPHATKANFPAPSHLSDIKPILETLSTTNMQDYLANLTSFNNRHYITSSGKAASQYIFDTVTAFAAGRADITVTKFKHPWAQFSVIAHINGSASPSASAPLVILGAHEDSINLRNPWTGRAPGADDDGSGTVNLLEVFRALVAADFRPSTPVEFHWYSGEEAGLLGSQAVAKAYRRAGTEVRAMLELDMTGYFKPGSKEVIALEADYMDAGETAFLKQLVETYSVLDWAMDAPVRNGLSGRIS